MRQISLAFLMTASLLVAPVVSTIASAQSLSGPEVTKIAEDAYVFAYPMLYGYQTLYTQTQDATFPRIYRRVRPVPSLCPRSNTCRSGHRHAQQRYDL